MSGYDVLNYTMCFVESILIFFFASHVLERRFQTIAAVILSTGVYGLEVCLIDPASVAVKMAVNTAVCLILCIISFKDSIAVILSCVIHAQYIIVISDLIFADLISIIQKTSIYNTIASSSIGTAVFFVFVKIVNAVLFTVSIYIFRRINQNNKKINWILLDIISGCFLIISITFANLYPVVTYNKQDMTWFLILSCTFFIASFLVLHLFVKLCDYFQKEQYWTVTSIKYESLRAQMDMQQEFVEASNKQRHDFKKLLGTISYLNSQKEYDSLASFLGELSDDAYSYRPVVYCGDKYINAILNIKAKECENCGIKLSVHTSPLLECNIKPDDIVLILANLLDNAIEAASEVTEENRIITVKIYNYERNLILYCENRYTDKDSKADFFQSEKAGSHGYGVKIILELVRSNNGQIDLEHENGVFKATIMMPN